MRKAQKQEVLEMIQTLHQAHDEIKNYIDKKNYALAQDILSQCQECAISIGTAIEKIEGEGFVTVSYVESYCDVVFSVYEELNGNDINANKAHKNLKKQLLRIENSVKNDVPVRKEIAFFPYKASMWDALESVYLAAKEDPDCDAYCVPIPYYDRNPDKSLGEMHYEGREYPKNIEVIDWQTYNFEERKPDVIYIHNPYDDWNLVTCVHPRFFSANLKKYTEELVYIPYFVLDEIEPDDQVRIDGMKHFCFLPGVVNADKVIVQSEKMKQIYVNEYLKAATANKLQGKHIDRKQLEEKFLGLGSPKFDKVKNTKKEDLQIPAEWLKIIEKPDGSWKKIIFYNTSIAALLEHNEKMLEKMKYVFSVFKENRDEVALLWRPHPLIKTTVSAMRPQLWVEYEKMVNQYRQEGWGIYDDSSDMDRAVVLSDAYYGDQSSVVQVYQQTGKPMMVQNVKVCNWGGEENGVCKADLTDAAYIDGMIWFCTSNFRCLVSMNLESKEKKYYEIPSNGLYSDNRAFGSMQIVGRKIYLIPFREKTIMQFDIDSEEFKQIEIDKSIIRNENILFLATGKYKEFLFIMGVNIPVVLRVNTNNNQIDYLTDWIEKVDRLIFDFREAYFRKQSVLLDYRLLVPFCNANAVLEIDCINLTTTVHKIGAELQGYSGICNDGKSLWLSPRKGGDLIKWNIDTGEIKKIPILQNLNNKNRLTYIGISYLKNRKMLLPIIEKENDLFIQEDICEMPGEYSFVQEDDENIIFYEKKNGILTLYNKKSNTEATIEIRVDDYAVDVRRMVLEKNNSVVELDEVDIRRMIGLLQTKE